LKITKYLFHRLILFILDIEQIKEITPNDKEDNATEIGNQQMILNKEENNKDEHYQLTESEGTVALSDNYYQENNTTINFNAENNEFNEIYEGTQLEEIDNYIDKIRNRFNKAKMMRINTVTKQQPLNSQNTENTICNNSSINNNNIIFEDICKIPNTLNIFAIFKFFL